MNVILSVRVMFVCYPSLGFSTAVMSFVVFAVLVAFGFAQGKYSLKLCGVFLEIGISDKNPSFWKSDRKNGTAHQAYNLGWNRKWLQ